MTFQRIVAIAIGILFLLKTGASALAESPVPKLPIPDKLVVLTFDDSVKSHYTVVRPLLRKYRFGATFFITEGFEFKTNKNHYMSWTEIARLHQDGFEIGNHTRDHLGLDATHPENLKKQLAAYPAQLKAINERCKEHGIPVPTSFAYPGNGIAAEALPLLKKLNIKFARRGGSPEYPYEKGRGVAYEPGKDHPLLLPTAGDARPDWELSDFIRAVKQAKNGRIAILQFHGAPDLAHSWVNTPVGKFEIYMKYLAENNYRVIALRDLEKYVDPKAVPADPFKIITERKKLIAQQQQQ